MSKIKKSKLFWIMSVCLLLICLVILVVGNWSVDNESSINNANFYTSNATIEYWHAGNFAASSNWSHLEDGKAYESCVGQTYTGTNGEVATGFNIDGHIHAQPGSGYNSLTVKNVKNYSLIGINGTIKFKNKNILAMGYYVDGNPSTLVKNGQIFDANIYGTPYIITASVLNFDEGTNHTITYVAVLDDGIVDLCTWDITMANTNQDVFIDTEKPNANVIILAGQSNAAGVSPITQDIQDEYGNMKFDNVHFHYANVELTDEGPVYHFTNKTFERYKVGIGGWGADYFGPELGIATYLSTVENTKNEKWYIIKFAPTGTILANQWLNGGTLANDMIEFVQDSINSLSNNFDVRIRSFVWMQGESDSLIVDWANSYAINEQILVALVRSKFAKYATRSFLAQNIPGSGISFIDGAIATNKDYLNRKEGGSNDWIYATTINTAKVNNCDNWYIPFLNEEGKVPGGYFQGAYLLDENENSIKFLPNTGGIIKNSMWVDTSSLTTKVDDWAHYDTQSMINLGKWFGEAIDYMCSKE